MTVIPGYRLFAGRRQLALEDEDLRSDALAGYGGQWMLPPGSGRLRDRHFAKRSRDKADLVYQRPLEVDARRRTSGDVAHHSPDRRLAESRTCVIKVWARTVIVANGGWACATRGSIPRGHRRQRARRRQEFYSVSAGYRWCDDMRIENVFVNGDQETAVSLRFTYSRQAPHSNWSNQFPEPCSPRPPTCTTWALVPRNRR